jgi:hypothetical protein
MWLNFWPVGNIIKHIRSDKRRGEKREEICGMYLPSQLERTPQLC